MTTLLI